MNTKDKEIDVLTGAVILNQLALDFNEALIHTRFYKYKLKNTLKLVIKELIKAESSEFDKVFDADSEQTENISQNVLHTMRLLSKHGFKDMVLLGSIIAAYKKNPKAIEGVVKKVLT